MRFPLIELANADPRRVWAPQDCGNYYQTGPKVFPIDRDQMSVFPMQTQRHQLMVAC